MTLRVDTGRSLAILALSVSSLHLSGCDGQGPGGGEVTAEIVGGATVDGRFSTGSRIAVRFTNTSDRALAYDQCNSGLEPESADSRIGRALVMICDPAPALSLRELAAGAVTVDTVYVPDVLPAGQYRYVFPVHEVNMDPVGEAVTDVIDVGSRP